MVWSRMKGFVMSERFGLVTYERMVTDQCLVEGKGRYPLAGQTILKSCSFSPETEFSPRILASKSEFS